MHFLTDPTWLGVIVGVLALIFAARQYISAKNKKSLCYEVISEYPLVSVDDEVKGKLLILFEGNTVENVHMLLIRFMNDGNVPITADDYERPITLIFRDDTDILPAAYVGANPSNLVTSTEAHGKKVSIKPVLMNGGDFFTIKILAGQYGVTFQVDTRIIGVRHVRRVRKQVVPKRWWLVSGVAALLGLFLAIPAGTELIRVIIFLTNHRVNLLHLTNDRLGGECCRVSSTRSKSDSALLAFSLRLVPPGENKTL